METTTINTPKVHNMTSSNGNKIANQFVIELGIDEEIFQSYKTIIAHKKGAEITLDSDYWDYSRTTSKYRNSFLDMTTQEIKQGIKSGSIKLEKLNGANHYA
tara:strand:- start:36938 stop:37243 length:306 start_codon:yes stop_codon:yes gene_type:complete